MAPREETNSMPVVVEVDLGSRTTLRHIWSFVGYDECNYTYASRGRELLAKLATMNDAPYAVRCHFLLCTGDGTPELKWGSSNVYTEDANGSPVYSWEIIDRIFDTYAEIGCVPFVEIGFMPEALSTAPTDIEYATPKGGGGWAYPPADYAKWHDLMAEMAKHFLERYGIGEVQRWYWELWNEPDIGYWKGTVEEYCTLYDHTEAALHSVIPQACLGGPGTTNPSRETSAEFLERFLDHCVRGKNHFSANNGTRLDFISFHSKGGNFKLDAEKNGHSPTIENLLKHITAGAEIAGQFTDLVGLPIHITECDTDGWAAGCMKDNPNFRHRNSEYYASFVAMAACRILPMSRGGSLQQGGGGCSVPNPVHSMLTWAFEFEDRDYFEGFRSLSTNGVDKPVLNSLRLLGRLGATAARTTCVAENVGVMASTDDAEGLRVLVCAHDDDWDATGTKQLQIEIDGLAPGQTYQVSTTRVDHTHGNSYTEWKRLGEPQSPSEDQLAAIHAASLLTGEVIGTVTATGPGDGGSADSISAGAATVNLAIESHAVCLVEIESVSG